MAGTPGYRHQAGGTEEDGKGGTQVKENSITIRLPGLPKGKGRPRFSRRSGRAYTPEQTVKYETSLAWVAKQVMNGREPLDGPLRVLIVSGFPVPKSYSKAKALDARIGALHPTKKPDIDNIVKLIDALNGIVWKDDAQIVHADVRKVYSATPELAIQVTPL
jgi:Holliday junction resolvase RusA-like endonuclease